ncbi:hypothetical protein IGI43_002008 [Enterococcus sp. AZ126]
MVFFVLKLKMKGDCSRCLLKEIKIENYFFDFSLEDQNFMIDFLLFEGNISRMCKKGSSYSKVKKKLQCINEQIGKARYSQDALKEYLDIFVSDGYFIFRNR